MTRARQPLSLMCIECGDTRPTLILPPKKRTGGLYQLIKFAFALHLISGVNSTIPSTRDYWRGRFPETAGIWKEFDQ